MNQARGRQESTAGDRADDHGLLFARILDGSGGARTVGWDEVNRWRDPGTGEALWVHLDRTVPDVEHWLADSLGISEPTTDVLVSNQTAPRAFREDDNLVTVLRGINLNPGAEPEDMVAIQIWADGNRLVSLRRRRLQTPRDVAAALDAGRGPGSIGDLLAELVEQLVAKMAGSIVAMNDRIDALEEAAEDEDADIGAILGETADIRRQCLALKRFMSPQHEALQRICRNPPAWFSEANCREVTETIEHLRRYLDDLDVSKESAIVLQDELNNRVADHSNRTMYMLSIVAAIFLPLSFVTGLLGINVGGMPGVHDGHAFWITVVALAILFVIQILLFRKIKWL